jgi:hypothetical protein
MKKRFAVLLLAILICACQPTPDSPVVVGKDQTGMIEQAKETIPSEQRALTIRERLGASERLTYAYHNGFLSINVDAEVIVPEGELPVVRVFPENFNQETVTGFWNALIGDVPMYTVVQEETKEEILEKINQLMQILEGDPENYGYRDRADVEQRIAALQERYRTAPDADSGIRSDGTLQRQAKVDEKGRELWSRTSLYTKSTETGYEFRVANNSSNEASVRVPVYDELGNEAGYTITEVVRNASLTFIKGRELQASCFVWDQKLNADDPLPKKADANLTIAPQQAISAASRLLADAGVSDKYAARHIFLIKNSDGTVFAYRVVCDRIAKGVPVLMTGNLHEGEIDLNEENTEWSARWEYEKLWIDVNDGGVYCVQFGSPLAIVDTITEESNLLPFDKIREIMEKMFPILYESETKDYYGSGIDELHEKRIDRVELGLWRIREQNSIERGLLVPVWVFYANTRDWQLPDFDMDTINETYRAVLIINAIDGSIIDPAKGY